MESCLLAMKFDQGLAAVMNAVRAGNRYMEKTAPWSLAKKGEIARLNTVLYTAADALRRVAVLLAPVMPSKMADLGAALGYDRRDFAALKISDLKTKKSDLAGRAVQDCAALFPRIQFEAAKEAEAKPAKQEKAAKPAKAAKEVPPVGVAELIDIADFAKVQLRTAKVIEASRVEGADRLLRLRIESGGEERQIVSGIARWYTPESLAGKSIVIVANLRPAKIRGIESAGMLLAAKEGDTLRLVTTDGEIASGAEVG